MTSNDEEQISGQEPAAGCKVRGGELINNRGKFYKSRFKRLEAAFLYIKASLQGFNHYMGIALRTTWRSSSQRQMR
ncbi:hypothetical protein SUGI_0451960 [Cryptomeria japonica]|nr:hypothetical protein SUGI_0451960 [Cryptomeria japonica]